MKLYEIQSKQTIDIKNWKWNSIKLVLIPKIFTILLQPITSRPEVPTKSDYRILVRQGDFENRILEHH
jgi:hypothetical protein